MTSLPRSAAVLLFSGLTLATLMQFTGCAEMFFTDAVKRDPPAPLTHAAGRSWVSCLDAGRATMLAGGSDKPAAELALAVRKDCSVEEAKMLATAASENGRDYADALAQREKSDSYSAYLIRAARARAVGADALIVPHDSQSRPLSREDFDKKVQLWDECLLSAANHFARGNPHDPATQLAHDVEGFCAGWRMMLSASYVQPSLGGVNATSEFIDKHGKDRLPVLAELITSAQSGSGK
jgi:hypothetical protein